MGEVRSQAVKGLGSLSLLLLDVNVQKDKKLNAVVPAELRYKKDWILAGFWG